MKQFCIIYPRFSADPSASERMWFEHQGDAIEHASQRISSVGGQMLVVQVVKVVERTAPVVIVRNLVDGDL